jgi:hypothetical protein
VFVVSDDVADVDAVFEDGNSEQAAAAGREP